MTSSHYQRQYSCRPTNTPVNDSPAFTKIEARLSRGRCRCLRTIHLLKTFIFYQLFVIFVAAQSIMAAAASIPWIKILQNTGRFILCLILFMLFATYNLPWATQHIAVISTTYFPLSASYAPDTMVVLFNAQKGFWPPWPLVCRSRNSTHGERNEIARIRYAFTPIFICKWSVYLAVCPVMRNPTEFALRDVHLNSRSIRIPYRTTSYDRKNRIVACFSPLFFNERWQLIIPTLELYRQMGVSLQVYYIQSMLLEILQFLQAYEKQNATRVKTWNSVSIGDANSNDASSLGYDPNTELEWRNQAAAHTDCLLKYKEVAEFIIVSDIDDVLIPRLGATFLDEFRYLTNQFPAATGFSYNRYNTELMTSSFLSHSYTIFLETDFYSSWDTEDFSLESLLASARIANEWEDPKYVVRPNKVESVWLHWPGIINSGHMVTVPEDLNIMLHFRNWTMVDFGTRKSPTTRRDFELFRYDIKRFMRPELATNIERGFRTFLEANSRASNLFKTLPREVHYYPLIAECYNRIFYGRGRKPLNCPGPIRCVMPRIEGLKCAMAQRRTKHSVLNEYVHVHNADSNGEFIVSNTGCRM